MTGISRQHAAEVVAELFQSRAYHKNSYDAWCVKDRNDKEWKFVRDMSIEAERRYGRNRIGADDTYRTEMVSPKLEYS